MQSDSRLQCGVERGEHGRAFALDGDTGEIRWYYQHLNDHWDLDHPYGRARISGLTPDLRPSAGNNLFVSVLPRHPSLEYRDRTSGRSPCSETSAP